MKPWIQLIIMKIIYENNENLSKVTPVYGMCFRFTPPIGTTYWYDGWCSEERSEGDYQDGQR